jgi:hypothetical protein
MNNQEPEPVAAAPRDAVVPAPPGLRRSGRARSQVRLFSSQAFDAALRQEHAHRGGHDGRNNDPAGDPAQLGGDDVPPVCALRAEQQTEGGDEPNTYAQAMRSADAAKWIDANQLVTLIDSHVENGSYTITNLPSGATTIGSRWVFKIKRDKHDNPLRYKSRMVAQGFSQIPGVHFTETFAPTLRMTSLRLILATATQRRWNLQQLDCKTAFLIPKLPPSEIVYMRAPAGVAVSPGQVLRLNKCIYGLRQASRYWNDYLHATITKFDFEQSATDACVYTKKRDGRLTCIIAIWVDDIIAAGMTDETKLIKEQLETQYRMTDGGIPTWLLGIAIEYDIDKGVMHLSQRAYIERLLKSFGMDNANSAHTPAPVERLSKSTRPETPEEKTRTAMFPFRAFVGTVMYLMITTRPDIAYAVIQLARFVNDPRHEHIAYSKRLMRYLQGTKDLGLCYQRQQTLQVRCYSDADWAGDVDTRRSVTGYVLTVNGGAISWRCQQQKTVAHSSCEAELMALAAALKEVLWMRKMLPDLGHDVSKPTTMFEDNQGCIAIATNQRGMTARTKHVATRYFAVREHVDSGDVEIIYCSTTKMIADIFTNPLSRVLFQRLRDLLGLTSRPLPKPTEPEP